MLRRRTGNGRGTSPPSTASGADSGGASLCGDTSTGSREREGGGLGQGQGDGSGDLDPTIARLVRKLTSRRWVVLYDSLKTTFALEAHGLAREVVFAAEAALAGEAASSREVRAELNGTMGKGIGERSGLPDKLEGIRACLRAWEAFKDWCEEVRIQRLPPFRERLDAPCLLGQSDVSLQSTSCFMTIFRACILAFRVA